MVTDAGEIEEVTRQIMEVEPEVVEGANVAVLPGGNIEYPYPRNPRLSNFVRFYHPDGTWSEIAAPTFNPERPTPYRQRFLMKYLMKRRDGKPWFFLKPQRPPPELPYRCFVEPGGVPCTKRVRTLADLHMHVMSRHGEESKMYADVLEAMKRKMQAQLDPALVAQLGLGESKPAEGPELFYCREDGCPRFFDSEQARNMHETGVNSPHKKREDG